MALTIGSGLRDLGLGIERGREREAKESANILKASQQGIENDLARERLKVSQDTLKLSQDKYKQEQILTAIDTSALAQAMQDSPEDTPIGVAIGDEIAKSNGTTKKRLSPSNIPTSEKAGNNIFNSLEQSENKLNTLVSKRERGLQTLSQLKASPDAVNKFSVAMGREIDIADKVYDNNASKAIEIEKKRMRDIDIELKQHKLNETLEEKDQASEAVTHVLADIDGVISGLDSGVDIFGALKGSKAGQGFATLLAMAEEAHGSDIIEGLGLESKTMKGQFDRIQGQEILNKIKTAKFGQLSEGEREFIATTVMTQDLGPKEIRKHMIRVKDILTLALDRHSLVNVIKDKSLRKKVSEDLKLISSPSEFRRYKRDLVSNNRDKLSKLPPMTMSREPDAVNTGGWTEAQYNELAIGTRFIDGNGVEGIIE